jgi:beta-glucosidase
MTGNHRELIFPRGFVWGTSTAAYQVEGGWDEDGKGPSIWDTFTHLPGKIERGETADRADDHYHRWPADLDLMHDLGIPAYSFSVSWPRVLPDGIGPLNPAGMDFYDRLVDGLLARGITPYLKLYHWDLPQALQDRGGWAERDTARRFADYAVAVAARLGDRVRSWITHAEPFVASMAGNLYGMHAPGVQDPFTALKVAHNLLLGHGCAVKALRSELPAGAELGIVLSVYPVHPASESESDRAAAVRIDGMTNRLFMDPLFRGSYPADTVSLLGPLFPTVQPGDLALIATRLDFVGLNYYTRVVVRHDPAVPLIEAAFVQPPSREYSQMWEIYPPGMYEVLTRVFHEYHPHQIYVTENGVPVPDDVDLDGRVRDERRIRYLQDHLSQVHRAIAEGVPVRGYFHWSFLDNFEWSFGYRMRFGLVYVDYATQQRVPKDSARWFTGVIRKNAVLGGDGHRQGGEG